MVSIRRILFFLSVLVFVLLTSCRLAVGSPDLPLSIELAEVRSTTSPDNISTSQPIALVVEVVATPEVVPANTATLTTTIRPVPTMVPMSFTLSSTSTPTFASPTTTPTLELLVNRYFEPAEFVEYYYDKDLPNLTAPSEIMPSITNIERADVRIIELAVSRGYRPQRQVLDVSILGEIDGVKLQAPVISAWLGLQKAAHEDGIELWLVSGYRNTNHQQWLFIKDLTYSMTEKFDQVYDPNLIAQGLADPAVLRTLNYTSPPNYTKHSTGYVIDIGCGSDFRQFEWTPANEWITKNNYENAKKFGFIPSYPVGLPSQGPYWGEAWEFIWVGER
jgi:D-alanyl-D-alanine carboxypeptidase